MKQCRGRASANAIKHRDWSSENAKHPIGRLSWRNIGPKWSWVSGGQKCHFWLILYVYNWSLFETVFFEILERTTRGEKRRTLTSEIARCYGREDYFEVATIRNYDEYQENGRHIIQKCEILKHIFFSNKKDLTKMITTRGGQSSYRAIRNDQKWRTWRGDRSSSNIAHSDAGRAELRDVPHGMFGNTNFAKQVGNKSSANARSSSNRRRRPENVSKT